MLETLHSNNKNLFRNYTIFNGLDNLYPVNWNECNNELLDKPYNNYKNIIRKYQPLIVLVNSVYKSLENKTEYEIINGNMPINYFINKSFENAGIYNYDYGLNNTTPNIYNKYDKNFGDGVNKIFWEKITNKEIQYNKNETHYITTGSIMNLVHNNSIILGSGFISEKGDIGGNNFNSNNNNKYSTPSKIIAVRGPLSRSKLIKFNIECPKNYADPLILIPCIYNKSINIIDKIVGIIPHYIDQNNNNIKILTNNLKKKGYTIHIIDITVGDNYTKLIDNINKCKYIISSSLHGIILGLIYKKKTIFLEFSNNVIGNKFKFYDFFYSLNIKYNNNNIYNYKVLDNIININYNTLLKIGIKFITLIPFINFKRKNELCQIYQEFYLDKNYKLLKINFNENYQLFYLKKAINELLINKKKKNVKINIKYLNFNIDHINGCNYINNIKIPLTFPIYILDYINKINKNKEIDYNFLGTITTKRDWINKNKYTFNSIIKSNNYGRINNKKYKIDKKYYDIICKSNFTLCPTGDCPWSYRFFEAIMCLSIPILEDNSNDIYMKDYFCFFDKDKHFYDRNKAIQNYKTFINSKHFLKNIEEINVS